MDLRSNKLKTTAVIAAIAADSGMVLWQQYEKSVNRDKFKQYLDILRHKLAGKDIVIFMDNLSVHRSKVTLDYMSSLGMEAIFNVAYSP